MVGQTSHFTTINASPTNANIIYNEGKRLPATRISKVRMKEDKRGGEVEYSKFTKSNSQTLGTEPVKKKEQPPGIVTYNKRNMSMRPRQNAGEHADTRPNSHAMGEGFHQVSRRMSNSRFTRQKKLPRLTRTVQIRANPTKQTRRR